MTTRERMARAAGVLSAHFGASTSQMKKDVANVGRVNNGGIDRQLARSIVADTIQNNYQTLHRFQDQASHNTPKLNAPSGIEMAEQWSKGVAQQRIQHSLPRAGSDHTQGQNQSQFVSLTGDLHGLHTSTDPWARSITRNANELHAYTIPNRLLRSPQRLADDIKMSIRGKSGPLDMKALQKDRARLNWLGGVPTQEKEVLYMGSNMGKYRTDFQHNPFKGTK